MRYYILKTEKEMNNYAKMRKSNSKIRKWLTENGYTCITFFPHTRFSKDIWLGNLAWDGVAEINNKLVLFQCKTNVKPSKKLLEDYRKMANKYGCRCLYLSYFDRKGVECFE